MPMGCTPGHLSRAMSLQATKVDSPLGYTKQVLSRLATAAKVSHNSLEADLNELQSRFQAAASKPDGPAAPSILSAVLRINWPSIRSKIMGWASVTGVDGFMIVSSLRGCFGGCLSRTLSEGVLGSIMLFRRNCWPVLLFSNQSQSCSHFTFHHEFCEFSR